jgi:2-phosphosulfolactate phosphatase
MAAPDSQYRYQVRFDWGSSGATAVGAGVDVLVWVDVLGAATPRTDPLPGVVPAAAVVAGDLRNRTAVAKWVLARQADKGDRFTVAIVAAGDFRPDGSVRFTVEDLLAAGAVVDALAGVGFDYCSPEAAAACAAFTTLTRATGHLISASGTGQDFIDRGLRPAVDAAVEIDDSSAVPVLRAPASR